MKKLILLGLATVLFAACQPNKPERFTTTGPEINEVKALVKDYHDGNWDSWLSHYADTAKIYHNTWETSATPKEMQESFIAILSNTSTYHFDEGEDKIFYEQIIDDDGKTWVNFWGNWRGTLKANGKELQMPVQISALMINGKIAEEYATYNISEFNTELQEIEAAQNTPKNNLGVIKGMYEAFAKGDIPAVLASIDANAIWNEAENFPYADKNPYIGPEAIFKGVFERVENEWEYWKLADLSIQEMANNYILGTGRYQAKYKENGKTIDAQFAHLFKLKDGKVINFQQYVDTKQVADAVISK